MNNIDSLKILLHSYEVLLKKLQELPETAYYKNKQSDVEKIINNLKYEIDEHLTGEFSPVKVNE